MVYEILNDHHLGQFYEIEDKAGIILKGKKSVQYTYSFGVGMPYWLQPKLKAN